MTLEDRPDVSGVNKRGRPAALETFRLLMYVPHPHAEIAVQARHAIERFVDLVSLDALAYTFGVDGDPIKLTPQVYRELIYDWFFGPFSEWPNANISLVGPGGSMPQYALTYCGKALGDIDPPNGVGFLDMWVPRSFFVQNVGAIQTLFQATASELGACAGYMAPTLAGNNGLVNQALAARYVTLDIADPMTVSFGLGTTSSPGSYWFNYAGPALAAALGPASEIVQAVGRSVAVKELADGALVVRLERSPVLGDRNRREDVTAYAAFARYLYTKGLLHVPKQSVYFQDAQALADRDAQDAWHLRFVSSFPNA